MRKRIGILGGTFNPIHLGHINMAKSAYRQCGLDKVLIMPAKNPPHKVGKIIASEEHRSNMCRLAIQDYPYMEFSDFEIKRDGLSYSVITLTLLKKQYDELFFIIGADSLYDMENWYQPDRVLALATMVVIPREDARESILDLRAQADYLEDKYNANIVIVDCPKIDISSTAVRKSFEVGEPMAEALDSRVYEYIVKEKLYERRTDCRD